MTLFNFVPSGTILPFGGTNAPPGWLICNGQAVSRNTYKNLFDAISTVWGNGDGALTFHLPDLRGRFMRGTDTMGGLSAGRDPDRASRAASNVGGNTGDNVGSVQTNATAKNGLTATSGTSSLSALTMNSSSISTLTLNSSSITLTMNSNTTSVSGNKNQLNGSTGSGSAVGLIRAVFDPGTSAASNHAAGYGPGSFVDYPNTTNYPGSDHTHSWDFGPSATFSASGTTPAQSLNTGTAAAQGLSSGTVAAQTLNASTVAAPSITINAGDNETRPLNANVNYIIKI